tara:strand:+ start:912 stop:1037 length:126 start_codon:yes stop_codon:yes gene_type:complete
MYLLEPNGNGDGGGDGGGGSLEITADHLICLCAVKHLTNKG